MAKHSLSQETDGRFRRSARTRRQLIEAYPDFLREIRGDRRQLSSLNRQAALGSLIRR
jgi:hypothetical protein